MKRQIIATTDGKFIGLIIDDSDTVFNLNGYDFKADKIQTLDAGIVRFSNSNYVIDTKRGD